MPIKKTPSRKRHKKATTKIVLTKRILFAKIRQKAREKKLIEAIKSMIQAGERREMEKIVKEFI